MLKSNIPKYQTRKSGSALLTAVIFVFVAAMLSGSFLKLAYNEYNYSVRSYLQSSAFNLAESGVELAIKALSDGSVSGSTWSTSHSGYMSDGGYTGDIDIVILNATSSSPTVYAEGIMSGHPSGDISKQIKVELSTGSIVPFEKGFAARDGVTMSGNGVIIDSYNSKYGAYRANLSGSGAPSDYGATENNTRVNKNDDITVASDTMVLSVGETTVDQGNADVYGYLATRENTNVSVGPRGMVTSYGSNSHDTSRISYDFYADFPVQSSPASGLTSISNITGARTLNSGSYTVSQVSVSGNSRNVVTVNGDVTLVVTGNMSFTGQSSINVTAGSTLTIYAEGDVAIAGNGINNTDLVPSRVSIIGTKDIVESGGSYSAGQTISISGNGQLAASVYAPGAQVNIKGGGSRGEVYGAVVGYQAHITGGSAFHFDEALRDIVWGGSSNHTIDSWLEMTGATIASTPIDMLSHMTP
ncbi:MAG: DUF7305 domain-containing protein [Coraliomargarita sp.]